VMALLVASVAIYQINTIGTDISRFTQKNMPMLDLISELAIEQLEQRILLQRMMRFDNGLGQDPQARDAERAFGDLSRKIDRQIVAGETLVSDALANEALAAPRDTFEYALKTLRKIRQQHNDFKGHTTELLRAAGNRQNADTTIRFDKAERESKDIATELNSLLIRFRADTQDTARQMKRYKKYAFEALTVLFTAATGLGLFCVWISMKGVHRQTPS